jgi:hypothetical protein
MKESEKLYIHLDGHLQHLPKTVWLSYLDRPEIFPCINITLRLLGLGLLL